MLRQQHLLVTALFWLAGNCAIAQQNYDTRYVVTNRVPTDWFALDSPQFQIHYSGENRALGELAVRYAEDAYYNLRRQIDYRTETRYQVYVYGSPTDFANAQYNQYEEPQFAFNLNRISVFYNGNQQDLYTNIKTKLAEAMLNELFFGGSTANSVQSKLLLHLPDWYITGASLQLGEGWTPSDEAYMRSLDKERGGFLEDVLISDRLDYHPVLKKSIWYFILNTYGRTKLVEIFYMTRITRSVQAAINRVLGLSMQGLTVNWVDFVNVEFQSDRVSLEESGVLDFKPPFGARVEHIEASPDGNSVAFYQELDGQYELKLYNFETGSIVSTPISFGKKTDFNAFRKIDFPIVWRPDGKGLATTKIEKGVLKLVYYDREEKKVEEFDLTNKLDWISSMAWSAKKNLLLISAVKGGQADLYFTKAESDGFTQVTRTAYDEINPAWSPDGERIFYASNAGDSVYTDEKKINYYQSRQKYDLYYLPYSFAGKKPTRITFSPFGNEKSLKLIGNKLFYITDENGLENLASLDLNANNLDPSNLSNYGTSVTDFGNANSSQFIVKSFSNGRPRFYLISQNDLRPIPFILKTRQAAGEYQIYLQGLVAKAKELDQREKKELEALKDTLQKSQPALGDSTKAAPDTTRKRERVRFYVFDDPEPNQPSTQPTTIGEKTQPPPSRQAQLQAKSVYDINNIRVSGASKIGPGVDLRLIQPIRLELDPILRVNFAAEAEITDSKLYNRLRGGGRIFSDFRSSDIWADYQLLRYRVQIEAGARKSSRYLDQFAISQNGVSIPVFNNYKTVSTYLGIAYPINRYQKVSLQGEYLKTILSDYKTYDELELGGYTELYGIRFKYAFDNSFYVQDYPLRGVNARFVAETYFRKDQAGPLYPKLNLELKSYTPLVKDIVIALRLNAGTTFFESTDPQERGRTNLIGGVDNWVFFDNRFDSNVGNEDFLRDVLVRPEGYNFLNFVTGVRGYSYSARQGRHYAVGNAEIRLPLKRIFNVGLNTRYMHNLLFVGFFDIGMAWNKGNPFSQTAVSRTDSLTLGPIDVTANRFRTPYIYSFGGGLRTILLGYDVKAELASGVDDGQSQPLKFLVSIGKIF